MMYLTKDDWSPRYDSTFYTVKVAEKTLIQATDGLPSVPSSIKGRDHLPAYYYTVNVQREHNQTSLLRRYSHFYWLYQQLKSDPPVDPSSGRHVSEGPIRMPPGICQCFQGPSDRFAQNRMEQLDRFLEDVLKRPGYANHPAVITFLELS